MKAEPFIIERLLNAPVARVWKAITNKDDMKQWYFDLEDFKPEVGFKFEFTGGTEENKYLHKCKVTEAIPNQKLTYSWRYEGYEGKSFVTWDLFAEGEQTRLKLTHAGLETFPPLADFAKSNFEMGWNHIIGTSIIQYLEKNG